MLTGRVKNQSGFTLVEVLAVIALGTLVLGLVFNIMMLMHNGSRRQSAEAELLYAARAVQSVILSEVRGACAITVADNGAKLLVSDVQGQVKGYLSKNGNFYRSYGSTSNPIAENVQTVRFSERDACLHVEVYLQNGHAELRVEFICALRG